MIKEKYIKVKWCGTNINHFRWLGYKFTRRGDEFKVKVIDLPVNSEKVVTRICDICSQTKKLYYRLAIKNKYCKSCSKEASKNPFWKGGQQHYICLACGYSFYRYAQLGRQIPTFCSRACRGRYYSGIRNHFFGCLGSLSNNWHGGKSFEPYSVEFNKYLKYLIKARDLFQCQLCGIKKQQLHIHHIDYDKKNNNLTNLITLCRTCHCRTNYKRPLWMIVLRKLMEVNYMALDKLSLYAAILAIWRINDGSQTVQQKAQAMADAIDTFVKSGAVAFSSGNVNGVCAAPGAPLVSGTASNGTIS